MNIRDTKKFMDTMWDWTPYNECFAPTKIRISDIDGVVERGGHFLFIETKLPNQGLALGQRLMYTALAQSPLIHVLVVWGKPNQPEHYMLWQHHTEKQIANIDIIKNVMRRWFQHVNKIAEPPLLLYVREAQRAFNELSTANWYDFPMTIIAQPFEKDQAA